MATCGTCQSQAPAPLFVLAEHEMFLRDARFQFMVTTFGNRTDLAPFVLSRCARCSARLVARRRRVKILAGLGLSGIAISTAGLVSGLAGMPTSVTLSLLFGGLGWFLVLVLVSVMFAGELHDDLGLEMSNVRLDTLTTDRTEVDAALKRRGLGSTGVRDGIDQLVAAIT